MALAQRSPLLDAAAIEQVVKSEVDTVEAVDVHTHLLPPSHADLLLYGIDELLTYHYLVAELFMILPLESEEDSVCDNFANDSTPPSTDDFFAWPKPRQADLVFSELFVKRTPLSEACRGVVTTLKLLGLGEMLCRAVNSAIAPERRLEELRGWFSSLDKEECV